MQNTICNINAIQIHYVCKRIYAEEYKQNTEKFKLTNKLSYHVQNTTLRITQIQVHIIYDDLEKYLIG